MKELTLAQIAEACGGTLIGGNEAKEYTVTGVEIDSRRVKPGDLFVAIPGEKVDGHKFIPDVLKKGAYALSQQSLDVDGAYILVEDTVTAMKRLARFYRNSLDIKVVGITGSVGKTSTKEMIASVLGKNSGYIRHRGILIMESVCHLLFFRLKKSIRLQFWKWEFLNLARCMNWQIWRSRILWLLPISVYVIWRI